MVTLFNVKFQLYLEIVKILDTIVAFWFPQKLRIHWRILKTSNENLWSNVFLIVKVYIFSKFIWYTIHWDKTQILKNFLRTNKRYKKDTLFLLGAPTHHSFTFDLQFLYDLKHKVQVYPSKTMCGIFHFRSRLVFMNVYIFVQQKAQTLWL